MDCSKITKSRNGSLWYNILTPLVGGPSVTRSQATSGVLVYKMPRGSWDRTKMRCIPRKDYTNMVFGYLTAIRLLYWQQEKAGHGGRQVWLFRCKCGNEVEKKVGQVATAAGVRGRIPSCGCRSYSKKLPPSVAPLRQVIRYYKFGAKSRNHEFELTNEQCLQLFSMDCHWCGAPPSSVASDHYKRKAHALYNGIDRVDNKAGYTIGNVVPCCSLCNYMKGTLSEDDFINHIAKIFNAQIGSLSCNEKKKH